MERIEASINRIPKRVREKLNNMKYMKHEFERMGNKVAEKEYKDTMRGILVCLMDMEVFSNNEFRALYVYYCTK